jgi:hypothetical protein
MSSLTYPSPLSATGRRQRAASLRQVLQHRASAWLRRVWTSLETTGRLRAAAELLQQALLHESTHPALAAALRQMAQGRPDRPVASAATAARLA